ncbi:MAG: EAL domain-containing protein [Chloroflexi bacterium]|nr:EAL domain-containing protein [Chloroflexota bacterium]
MLAIAGRVKARSAAALRSFNLTIGWKLSIGFGVLLLLLVITGLIIDRSLRTIDANLSKITEVEEPESAAASEMEINLIGTGFAVFGYLNDRDPQYLQRIEDDGQDFAQFQQQYHKLSSGHQEQNLAADVERGYERFTALADTLISIEDEQAVKMEAFLANLDEMEVILDDNVQASLSLNDPVASQKLHASHELEVSANSIAKDLGNYLRTHQEKYAERVYADERNFDRYAAVYEGLDLSLQERQWSEQLHDLFDESATLAKEIIELDKEQALVLADFVTVRRVMGTFLDEIQALTYAGLAAAKDEANSSIISAQGALLTVLIGSFVVGGGMAFAIGRGITKPIRKLVAGAEEIGSGNLAHRIDVDTHDEIGELAVAFNLMAANLATTTASRNELDKEITERKRAEETIKHQAYYDELTGLPNRRLFEDQLDRALAQARRKHQRLVVMFLDLDRFKTVNDTVGHNVGDELLQSAGKRLTNLLRDGDTVARMGGDEFTILLPEVDREEDILDVARRILDSFRQPWTLGRSEFVVTASIGIAVWPNDGHDGAALLKNADMAMYRAKDQGRDNFQLYSPAMNAEVAARLVLEKELRRALRNEEFVVYYQPQQDIRTGQIVGVEALVRWQHPERGLILPGEFIAVAEESELIVRLGEWVLRTACTQAKAWQDAGLPPLRMAVNFSARQFQHGNPIATFASVLTDTGLDPKYLELEITERVAMSDVRLAMKILSDLRDLGVRIALDDFGIGHSSLAYLKRFPIDALKIDQSFIRDLTTDPDSKAIAATIIAMAHNLNHTVIAEGVETEEQLAFLREQECDEFQGYLLSRPVPADELLEILTQRERGRNSAKASGERR